MVVVDDIRVTEKELETIRNLVRNHKYNNLRKGILIFRNVNTGEITIENQIISFEDNGGMMFRRDIDQELLWWYEKSDWELNGSDDEEMANEVVETMKKVVRVI
ncbi:hypothetical protein NH288_04835 [Anaerococcus sp. NML200537]|uniref:hypothetical protein n=1 Tax=Anaerococcus sp. NML200537 TaxID=2954485 RepID=UPI002237D85F|nr:hypothetical protein [Anaerococcus sp. NML200537]MCW6701409.1 hypothetical protein [Anaerococcus sp. NML200537]